MLEDLLHLTEGTIPADDVFALIAADVLYVDLCAAPLAEPAIVKVFTSREAASSVADQERHFPATLWRKQGLGAGVHIGIDRGHRSFPDDSASPS